MHLRKTLVANLVIATTVGLTACGASHDTSPLNVSDNLVVNGDLSELSVTEDELAELVVGHWQGWIAESLSRTATSSDPVVVDGIREPVFPYVNESEGAIPDPTTDRVISSDVASLDVTVVPEWGMALVEGRSSDGDPVMVFETGGHTTEVHALTLDLEIDNEGHLRFIEEDGFGATWFTVSE